MDPLIRFATMAPVRTRLSEARAGLGSGMPDTRQPAEDSERARMDALRLEIETQVRAELEAQWRAAYDSERDRAWADGHAEAVSAAKAAAAAELAELRQQLEARAEAVLSAIERAHQAAVSKLESSVGQVAFAAVCRIVGQQAASQAAVLALVQRVCSELRGETTATARLHPQDIATLRDLLHDGELRIESVCLKVVTDESIELGGCRIEADSGTFDGTLEGQLRRLHAVLTGARNA